MNADIKIEPLETKHLANLVAAFSNYGGDKSEDKFKQIIQSQEIGISSAWIIHFKESIAGYVIVHWDSCLPEFRECQIPEISDLNVLPEFRGKGIASALLNEIEIIISKRSKFAGIGVGLTNEYAAAQRLYVRRGYVPLGNGLTYKYNPVSHGQTVLIDDDLVFWLTKLIKDFP